jgi:alpha-D-ribose 1-methylphosphonate 5-triphosphate synthase subunit PhnH
MASLDGTTLVPGLADPVHGAQQGFRLVLDAMAHPGRIHDLGGLLAAPPPAPLAEAAAVVLLALCDVETPLFLSPSAAPAAPYLRFHCGAPLTAAPAEAGFALVANPAELPALDRFALGSDEYPDRATTLILEVASLAPGAGCVLTGPGIDGRIRLAVGGVPEDFWQQRAALARLFPRGLDLILTAGTRLAALPRSTIEER